MTFCFILALVFLVLSILLFSGKGGWIIAGYNALDKAEKEKYDKKKLCRAIGVLCLLSGGLLFAIGLMSHLVDSGRLSEKAMLLFTLAYQIVLFTTIGIVLWYINKKAKK